MPRALNENPRKRPAPRKRPKAEQLVLPRLRWGGKRRGAGRKGKRPGAVSHRRRPALASRFPVHVSLSVAGDIPTLRQPDVVEAIEQCLREIEALSGERGFRVAHYSIQRHHVHLIVEAKDAETLSRGMQGLAVRVARRINKVLGRRGKVFTDRYFERILKTPKQVRFCILYVLNNLRRHAAQAGQVCASGWVDPFSSGRFFDGWKSGDGRADQRVRPPPNVRLPGQQERPTVSTPRTWLLSVGWRRHGLIPIDAVPGQKHTRSRADAASA